MSYTPITKGPFDLIIEPGEKAYQLPGVPADATEVLIYFFISVRDSNLHGVQRAFYEMITCDGSVEYAKYMNAIFTKHDYVMNSENMWLPLGTKKELKVKLSTVPWPPECKKSNRRTHKSLEEAKKDYVECKDDDPIFAEFFIIGYQ